MLVPNLNPLQVCVRRGEYSPQHKPAPDAAAAGWTGSHANGNQPAAWGEGKHSRPASPRHRCEEGAKGAHIEDAIACGAAQASRLGQLAQYPGQSQEHEPAPWLPVLSSPHTPRLPHAPCLLLLALQAQPAV